MTMSEWAEKEVELYKEDCDGYFSLCADSALKAFKSLCEDGHSGMSICFTRDILVRLIDGEPLTAVEDREEDWEKVGEDKFQHKRMCRLFKTVKNGKTSYFDVDRVYGMLRESTATFTNGLITRIIDEMYPITMPYMPNGRYCVIVEDYLYDEKNGDYDTRAILSVKEPDGTVKLINRYFKETEQGFIEIDFEEYAKRKGIVI